MILLISLKSIFNKSIANLIKYEKPIGYIIGSLTSFLDDSENLFVLVLKYRF